MTDFADLICANPGCNVSKTGKCMEGLDTDTCPHCTKKQPAVSEEVLAETLPDSPVRGSISLAHGKRMSITEAETVLRAADSRVIALVGPFAAGKTSLIASLYDKIQNNSCGDFRFTRSHTLFDFEQVCHPSRIESRRLEPHTDRTPFGVVSFFHLGLCNTNSMASLDLVIADRAGEDYKIASDDISRAPTFAEISRSDTLSVLIDGQRLLSIADRHKLRSDVQLMIQALADSGSINHCPRLAIVLTKFDLLESAESTDKVKALAYFEEFEKKIRDTFSTHFQDARVFRIAASPSSVNVLPRGYGLLELLEFWYSPPPTRPRSDILELVPKRIFGRVRP